MFITPFEMNLNPNNRWVKLSKSIPWDELASIYYQAMNSRKGAPSIDAWIVIRCFNQMNERIINKALCLNSPKAKVQIERK